MNTEQQFQAERMMNNPSSHWMGCSHSAPRQQANQAAYDRFDRHDQRPTRFPTSSNEMSNRESAFYFADEER